MKKLKRIIFTIFVLYFQSIPNAFAERELHTFYFHDIAVSEIDNYDSIDTEKMYKKVIIQKIIPPSNEEIKTASENMTAPKVKLGETIWEITPQMLPANKKTCIKNHIPICFETPFRPNTLSGCYNDCIEFGPTFLSYDEKRKKLYLLGDTVLVGQKSGFFLGFVADLNTKQIKFLKKMDGYIEGTVSPDGGYILLNGLYGRHVLTLYNIKTNEETIVDENKPLGDVKWLNEKRFSYRLYNHAKESGAIKSYKTIERRAS